MTNDTDRTMEQIKAALTEAAVTATCRGNIPVSDERFAEIFWSRVERGADGDCWTWRGTRHWTGYGVIQRLGRQYRTHRMAWMLANHRDVPEGMLVCHTCDNRPCCNPAHLWIGTCADNLRDCAAKGRNILQVDPTRAPVLVKPSCRSIGARNGMAKLTDESVRVLRQLRAEGWRVKDIAQLAGLNKNHLGEVLSGKKWGHVA
jgi:hypothetical protein